MSKGHGEHDGYDEQGHVQYNPPGQGQEEALFRSSHPQPRPSSFECSLTPLNRPPPRRIDHTYRDYSDFPLGELPMGKRTQTSFPSKLHHILSAHEYSHIISWMPHGRAWRIHHKDLLMREVVPKYFVQSKFESFTRQLNGWGFKRLHQSGNDFNAYYHECFLMGFPHLTVLMKRVPPNQGKLLPHAEGEPNFYVINKQYPLPPPMIPYHGHFQHSPYDMAASTCYGASTKSPTGHHRHNHHSSYPSNYPPPPAYYPNRHDPHAATTYALQPDYPHYAYYPSQSGQPPPETYPHYHHPPGPLRSTQSHNDNSLPNNNAGPVKSIELPLPHAVATYVSQPDYSHHYPTQYSQPPSEHCPPYPYPPGPLYGTQSHYDNPPPNNNAGPVKSTEFSSAPPLGQEERVPIKDEDLLPLLSICAQSDNAITKASEK